MKEMQYCEILKTRINVTNMENTVAYIEENIEQLRGRYICVSNVHTTVMSYENVEYRKIQNSAALTLPDGAPLSIYSRHKGYKEAKRVTGPDLMLELFKQSQTQKYTHFFYGATQETLDAIKAVLERDYPDISVAGMYSPPFRPLTEEEDKFVVDMISKANPDFIWVGLGAPKQEEWMYNHRAVFGGVMIGVGAGFDYLAGYIKRAPGWMQKLSLEWLYRLMQDPKRLWKRYVTTNIKFFRFVCKERRQR